MLGNWDGVSHFLEAARLNILLNVVNHNGLRRMAFYPIIKGLLPKLYEVGSRSSKTKLKKFYKINHLDDKSGKAGEGIPPTVLPCLKWFEARESIDNSPKATRIRKNKKIVTEILLEPRAPLAQSPHQLPRSTIARENNHLDTDSGIVDPTVTSDDNATTNVTALITPRKNNVISSANTTPSANVSSKNIIEKLKTSQSDSYVKAMNENMLEMTRVLSNPKRTYREMMIDYKEAQQNLKDAINMNDDDDIKILQT